MSAIPPVTPQDPEAASADLSAENIQALKALFPEVFGDGRIDFDVLRQLLGDAVDDGDEKYGLNWSGKRRARRLALTPSLGTLRPAPEDSVEWDTTQNLMIEGDNLEVLKLLQKSYAGRAKLIYIDPPYNTGNDFVYPDDYADSLGNYLRRTGQKDAKGIRNTTNAEGGGRYHTDWLNMMLPRLMLSKQLLRKDGLIAVSCDDAERDRLRILMDSVYGEDNFIDAIVWKKRYGGGAKEKFLVTLHDYCLVYARNIAELPELHVPQSAEGIDRYYTKKDENYSIRGGYRTHPLEATKSMGARPNLVFGIQAPDGSTIDPKRQWLWSKERVEVALKKGEIEFLRDRSGDWSVHTKQYLKDESGEIRKQKAFSIIDDVYSQHGTNELIDMFGDARVFSFPKPVGFVRKILDFGSPNEDDLIIDFFAGSGTTAHAVMHQNASDGGHRRYILVQLPEPLDSESPDQKTAADFCDGLGKPRNIAELTKERLRRAAAKVKIDNPKATFDGGFRVYKLATSNLKAWQPGDDLEADLLSAADNLVEARTEDDLLVELLLKQGVDLTEPVQTRQIAARTVHAFGGGVLVVCLGDVDAETADALADGMADWIAELAPVTAATVFFKDAGFQDDQAKTNVAAILEQRLGDDLLKVRSV